MSASHTCFSLIVALSTLTSLGQSVAMAEEVNIYSYRQPSLITPLLKAFQTKTGIRTNIIFAKQGLESRILAEGEFSPADVLLTVDVGRLRDAKLSGISRPLSSELVQKVIPESYRDKEGHWFGLTQRARVIYASNERVKDISIRYEGLSDPKWKGRICTRSGQHSYNLALFASMLLEHGESYTRKWLEGLRDNLAMKPSGDDRAQIKNIYAGQCDIALGNTYYMGKMLTNDKTPEQKIWSAATHIIFPNNEDRGTQVDISGMLLAKHAPNRANAIKLMEFLVSTEAQELYARRNFEYPVRDGVPWSPVVKAWGAFKADPRPLLDLAKARLRASELVDEVNFDAGPQ